MTPKSQPTKGGGFTLIELLVVTLIIGILAAPLLGAESAQVAVIEAWVQRFKSAPTNHVDKAWAVAVDAWGNVAVTGSFQMGTGQNTRSGTYLAIYAATNGALLL